MKVFQSIIWAFFAFFLAGSFASCKKDDLPNNGEPRIRYVRITEPTAADSLLIGAAQGQLIAIMGENLNDTREVWFNDQKAILTSTYITATSILVSVPSPIPIDVSNKVKLIFGNGTNLEYQFEVQISEPLVGSMVSEYVATGDVATIRGDYFYEPITVAFAGGVEGEIVSVEPQILRVKIPEGAQPGQVTVTTNFGSTKSNFWFRDNRNIVISSDPFTGWWNASYVVSAPGPDDPQLINGNYIRVKKVIGDWAWTEVAGGPADAMGDISKNIPDEAILKPELYNLKFEVNTKKPYDKSMVRFNFGLAAQDNANYQWAPPIDTKGAWQTVTIPFNELASSYNAKLAVNPNGYWTRVLIQGPGEWDADISFDNFRIVPKEIKE
ncbi:glycan-binding surface protein [Flavihumibacter petaseus]|uniref:Surface glycan-binding protein B xyloglucan binding domain-containing protein n=1 Tax=Flavihumibacter petaseus NBRC 106054 TaxID=1220578 RepID=A0A0E9N3U5_9BACT|nr:glycan-binding surface protein [Flavihumibacter petaseus]GAO44652.1 hypothetical protein FPE01S_03_06910 [Flavihumibacter petaseus NBRC 106054]